ncbi:MULTISPECIES: hypothetical protein [unclassified Modestobacter]
MTRSHRVSTRNGQPLVNQNDPERRTSVERLITAQDAATDTSDAGGGDKNAPNARGLFQEHSWLVPVTAVAAILAAFGLMIALTALAGGTASFGG